ncbi:MAG TPA: nuclease, partial [Actinotalea sp.]|nr:nuclease [Actinotalea sp.]
LQTFDLESDVQAFTVRLPRLRIIPLAEFDPTRYL